MSNFDLLAVLLVLAALLSYVNHLFLKLPTTIGLMALTLAMSLLVVALGPFFPGLEAAARGLVGSFVFDDVLLHGMLGFLLFAGALHVELDDLREWRLPIAVLASLGVLISTFLVGGALWLMLPWLGFPTPFLWCLLFGALISPTDPIAVLGLLKQMGAPRSLEVKIVGESLFNDGIGVVVFLGLLEIATGQRGFDPGHLAGLFLKEAVGGAIFGWCLGATVNWMLAKVDNYQVEVLVSLATVAGGYAGAEHLHISAPIAMVVAGLMIGNEGRTYSMSKTTVEHLDTFWELIDEILNAVLFVLIGLEVLIVTFSVRYAMAGALAIVVVLVARLLAVGLPVMALRRWAAFGPYTVRLLTWGGLRGGISVALALALPVQVGGQPVAARELVLVLTYMVVVFSILVQGLTVGPLMRRWLRPAGAVAPPVEVPSPG